MERVVKVGATELRSASSLSWRNFSGLLHRPSLGESRTVCGFSNRHEFELGLIAEERAKRLRSSLKFANDELVLRRVFQDRCTFGVLNVAFDLELIHRLFELRPHDAVMDPDVG